jgi:gamma-glutamylcyclotransferase (GGCT)/AIG2-like uncharacterized protein YtfP
VIFFSYGTLLDPEYQRELFDRVVPTQPATLHGWRAVFTPSGYLTIVPDPAGSVAGALVDVDERELALCDAWEDVPLYERVGVEAVDAHGTAVATWAYVRAVDGGDPAPPGVLSRASRAAVVDAIRALRSGGGGHASGSLSGA